MIYGILAMLVATVMGLVHRLGQQSGHDKAIDAYAEEDTEQALERMDRDLYSGDDILDSLLADTDTLRDELEGYDD